MFAVEKVGGHIGSQGNILAQKGSQRGAKACRLFCCLRQLFPSLSLGFYWGYSMVVATPNFRNKHQDKEGKSGNSIRPLERN